MIAQAKSNHSWDMEDANIIKEEEANVAKEEDQAPECLMI